MQRGLALDDKDTIFFMMSQSFHLYVYMYMYMYSNYIVCINMYMYNCSGGSLHSQWYLPLVKELCQTNILQLYIYIYTSYGKNNNGPISIVTNFCLTLSPVCNIEKLEGTWGQGHMIVCIGTLQVYITLKN